MSSFFNNNRKLGGVVDTGTMGGSFTKVMSEANNAAKKYINLGKGRANGRKKKNRDGFKKYSRLDNGHVYYIVDRNNKYTVLKFNGYDSLYLGKSDLRNATRTQKFRKVNWRCAMMYHNFKKTLDTYGIDVDKCVIIEGCYNTNIHTLQRTFIPEKKGEFSEYPSKGNLKKLEEAVKVVMRKMDMYTINEIPNFDYIYNTKISPSKKPGFRYEECFVLKNKEESLVDAIEVAKLRWNYINTTDKESLNHEKMYNGVYTIGARNKRDYDYDDGDLAVSRAVHMPEFHVELTSCPWVDLLTDKIKSAAKGPIYIGNSMLEWNRLKHDLEGSEFVLEGDYKRFDSTLYIRIITAAVAIMRCMYPIENEFVDKHFIAMYDSLAIKDYYVVGGNVFRAYHGLPSGVKSTSILGSIINLISLVYNIGPLKAKNFNFIIGGDDFLIACFKMYGKLKTLINTFKKRCQKLGMKIKFLDVKQFGSSYLDKNPVFYKYTIYKDAPVVPNAAYLERIFMPWNRKYKKDSELIEFLWAAMPSLGTPMSHLILYYAFLRYMLKIKTGTNFKMGELYNIHRYQFKKMIRNKDMSKLKSYDTEEKKEICGVIYSLNKIKKDRKKIKFDISIF